MYAHYRNYDAALGAVNAVPGNPGFFTMPIAEVRANLTRLGLDPSDIAGSLRIFGLRPEVAATSSTYIIGTDYLTAPLPFLTNLMGGQSPVVASEIVEMPWTVKYHRPLIIGLLAVGVFAAYKLLWKPSRRVRMTSNRRRTLARNSKGIVLDGYVFEYDGSGDGSLDDLAAAIRAPDDDWGITMVSQLKARAVGSNRTIDDARVTIFQGSDGRLYAAGSSAIRLVTANGRRGVPRVGTRVRFDPDPVSLAMYSHPPRTGEEGTVSTVAGVSGPYMPGPGGGLLYVDWDESAFQGVSLWDVVVLPRGKQKNWGGRFKKGGGR